MVDRVMISDATQRADCAHPSSVCVVRSNRQTAGRPIMQQHQFASVPSGIESWRVRVGRQHHPGATIFDGPIDSGKPGPRPPRRFGPPVRPADTHRDAAVIFGQTVSPTVPVPNALDRTRPAENRPPRCRRAWTGRIVRTDDFQTVTDQRIIQLNRRIQSKRSRGQFDHHGPLVTAATPLGNAIQTSEQCVDAADHRVIATIAVIIDDTATSDRQHRHSTRDRPSDPNQNTGHHILHQLRNPLAS